MASVREYYLRVCTDAVDKKLIIASQPFLRRIITRLIGLIPSVVVAIAVGRPGIDSLLVASQVALAIVLPFVAAPLIWLTSSKAVMSVRNPQDDITSVQPLPTLPDAIPAPLADVIEETTVPTTRGLSSPDEKNQVTVEKHQHRVQALEDDSLSDENTYASFASGWLVTVVASLVFFVILAANLYAIVMLVMGKT